MRIDLSFSFAGSAGYPSLMSPYLGAGGAGPSAGGNGAGAGGVPPTPGGSSGDAGGYKSMLPPGIPTHFWPPPPPPSPHSVPSTEGKFFVPTPSGRNAVASSIGKRYFVSGLQLSFGYRLSAIGNDSLQE